MSSAEAFEQFLVMTDRESARCIQDTMLAFPDQAQLIASMARIAYYAGVVDGGRSIQKIAAACQVEAGHA